MRKRLLFWFLIIPLNALPFQISYADSLGLKTGGEMGLDLSALTYLNNQVNANALGFGGCVEYQLTPFFEVGISLTSTPINPSVGTLSFSSIGIRMYETFITGDFNYRFSEKLSPLYLGVRVGLGLTSISISGTPASSLASVGINGAGLGSSFAFGALGGYDLPIIAGFSLGPRLSYMVSLPSSIESGILTDLQLHLSLKYAF